MFYSPRLRNAAVVTLADSAADVNGSPAVRAGLKAAFPAAFDRALDGKLRVRGLAIAGGIWVIGAAAGLLIQWLSQLQ